MTIRSVPDDASRYEPMPAVQTGMLLTGAAVAWDGLLWTVTEIRQPDGSTGRGWVVVLHRHDRPDQHLECAEHTRWWVFTGPHPVCSCHGDPWPCNPVWERRQADYRADLAGRRKLLTCHACGNERNLDKTRIAGGEHRRYCRRKACQEALGAWLENAVERHRQALRERAWLKELYDSSPT